MSIFIAIASLVGYLLILQLVSPTITRLGNAKSVNPYRITYITKTINIALTAIAVLLINLMLSIEYSQLAFFTSSVFAVLGVAMFAQRSILNNITASLIIFFAFPYRVGDEIKIVDKDDGIEGIAEEITLMLESFS